VKAYEAGDEHRPQNSYKKINANSPHDNVGGDLVHPEHISHQGYDSDSDSDSDADEDAIYYGAEYV